MNKSRITSDFIAGIVVFLIAVPLCLGIALASGAPLMSGMISGIVGGIVVGSLSKSQLSVTGPAAGLTAIVIEGIHQVGTFEAFLVALILAGLFQICLGFLKAGNIAYYFPSNVIKGMLCAIGIIIIMKQFSHFVGYDAYPDGDLYYRHPDGETTLSILYRSLNYIHPGVLMAGLLSLCIMVLWDKYKPARMRLFPGALLAVLTGVICNKIYISLGLNNLIILPEHLVSLPIPESFEGFLFGLPSPDFSSIYSRDIWILGLTMAFVASVETLLTIEATDRLDPEKRITPTNRELLAQGFGNAVSGLLGGLPQTSVIVRSSANINAGGRTKLSTIFHGVFLLTGVLFLPRILNQIPLTSLAAILIVTGYKLTSPAVFMNMLRRSRSQWGPFLITVTAIVFTDLLTGVLIGMGVSFAVILSNNLKNTYYFHKDRYKDGDLIHLVFAQEVTFLNKAAISLTLDHLPRNSYVLLDATQTRYMDYDVLEIIKDFADTTARNRGIQVIVRGFKEEYQIENNDHIFFESVNDYPTAEILKKGVTERAAFDILYAEVAVEAQVLPEQ